LLKFLPRSTARVAGRLRPTLALRSTIAPGRGDDTILRRSGSGVPVSARHGAAQVESDGEGADGRASMEARTRSSLACKLSRQSCGGYISGQLAKIAGHIGTERAFPS
jgi:hypothetical protein